MTSTTDNDTETDTETETETVRETHVENATLAIRVPASDVHDDDTNMAEAIEAALFGETPDVEYGRIEHITDFSFDVTTDGETFVAFVSDGEFTVWDDYRGRKACGPEEVVKLVLSRYALATFGFDIRESYTVERYD